MRILHFDCFSGISGDMTVGALADLGVEADVFLEAISSLGLGAEMHAHLRKGIREGISGTKFDVHVHSHDHSHDAHVHEHHGETPHVHGRTYKDILTLLDAAALKPPVRDRAKNVFRRIALAEGKIHGIPPEDVGFHEVGAADSIADIVAACAGFDALGPLKCTASELSEGRGWVDCAHGRFPVPAPATLEILAGIPLNTLPVEHECITPTGAALVAEFAESFGPMPSLAVQKIGYGLGSRDTPGRPNVLRAVLGAATDSSPGDTVSEISANLDDLQPELAATAMERLLTAGALDVFFTPVQMKKNRPGVLLTVICTPERADEFAGIILRETTTFGVRIHNARRATLRREIIQVETPYGYVDIKLGYLDGERVQASPEYESCRILAGKTGASVREVFLAAQAAATGFRQ